MVEFLDTFYPRILDVHHVELTGSREYARSDDECYLIYVYGGRGGMEHDDVAYTLSAGHVLQVPSEGAVLRNAANGPLRYYAIRFRYKHVVWEGDGVRVLEPGDRLLPLDPVAQIANPLSVLEELQALHRLWTQRQAGDGKPKLAFMNLLQGLLAQQNMSYTEITTKRSILACVDYIEQHYQESLERETLARKFSISSSYFSVLFKKYVGCSPVQYITKVRIAKAMELLKDSSMPVSNVALEVGFNDPLYFTRVFSRQVGVTPKQFREAR